MTTTAPKRTRATIPFSSSVDVLATTLSGVQFDADNPTNIDFPAMLTRGQAMEIDEVMRSHSPGWRMALCVLEKNKAELVELFRENSEIAITITDHVEAWVSYFHSLAEAFDVSIVRLHIAAATAEIHDAAFKNRGGLEAAITSIARRGPVEQKGGDS